MERVIERVGKGSIESRVAAAATGGGGKGIIRSVKRAAVQ